MNVTVNGISIYSNEVQLLKHSVSILFNDVGKWIFVNDTHETNTLFLKDVIESFNMTSFNSLQSSNVPQQQQNHPQQYTNTPQQQYAKDSQKKTRRGKMK